MPVMFCGLPARVEPEEETLGRWRFMRAGRFKAMNQTKLKTMCAALREMRRKYARLKGEQAALPKRFFFPADDWRVIQERIDATCGLMMRQEAAILDYVMGDSK